MDDDEPEGLSSMVRRPSSNCKNETAVSRETAANSKFLWRQLGSNQRPKAYESSALPLSYGAKATSIIANSGPFDNRSEIILCVT
jgi:hypothetical protein